MLSTFGPLAALAGNPGSPTNSCGTTLGAPNPTPGQGGPNPTTGSLGNGGPNAGGAHNSGSQASSVYPNTQTGNAGNTAPHAGAQYDASCAHNQSNK
jgi:hypothetical protein